MCHIFSIIKIWNENRHALNHVPFVLQTQWQKGTVTYLKSSLYEHIISTSFYMIFSPVSSKCCIIQQLLPRNQIIFSIWITYLMCFGLITRSYKMRRLQTFSMYLSDFSIVWVCGKWWNGTEYLVKYFLFSCGDLVWTSIFVLSFKFVSMVWETKIYS